MENMCSYDVIKIILDEAGQQFGTQWFIPEENKGKLISDCEIIDQLVTEFYCESMDVEVDDTKMNLIISLICPDMVLEYGRTHPFFTLIKHTSKFGFSALNGSLKIDLTFSNLWQHKDRGEIFE